MYENVSDISYYFNIILNMIILPIEHIKFRYTDTVLFLYIYNKYKLLVPAFCMFSTIAQLLNSKDKTRQAATTNLIVL